MSTNYIEKVKRTQGSSFVGYWPLNEERGTTVFNAVKPLIWGDTTPESNGTSSGLVRTPATAGFLAPDGGKCAQFDGSVSYIDMVSALSSSATDIGSLSIWVATPQANLTTATKMQIWKFAAAGADNFIDLTYDTTSYRFNAAYECNTTDVSVNSSLVYNVDGGSQSPEWHHFGVTYADTNAGDALTLYVDGKAETAVSSLGEFTGSFATTTMVLGTSATTPADQFTGWLSHFAWWSVILTAAEMRDLAKAGP